MKKNDDSLSKITRNKILRNVKKYIVLFHSFGYYSKPYGVFGNHNKNIKNE